MIVPRVMRALATELRSVGELPAAPAHFGVLSALATERRSATLTDLALRQGVSLPTMSNTITAMAERGWVRRVAIPGDRRIVHVALTAQGRAALRRVGRTAAAHLAARLSPLTSSDHERLDAGLDVLMDAFSPAPAQTMLKAGHVGKRRRPKAIPPNRR